MAQDVQAAKAKLEARLEGLQAKAKQLAAKTAQTEAALRALGRTRKAPKA